MATKVEEFNVQLKALYAKRDRIYSRMQSICDHINNLETESVRESFLCEIETIDILRENFEGVLDKIIDLEASLNPKYVISYQALSAFEDLWGRAKRAAKTLPAADRQSDKKSAYRAPKLPPIEIPLFDGDIKHWPLFFASFKNAVHDNTSLTESEKLYYLIGKLSGPAKLVCSGVTPCAENYALIIDLLKTKYEDKRLVATTYLDQLFNFKPISSATPFNLEQFLDKFASSVAALKNIKVNDLSDFLFLYMALKK